MSKLLPHIFNGCATKSIAFPTKNDVAAAEQYILFLQEHFGDLDLPLAMVKSLRSSASTTIDLEVTVKVRTMGKETNKQRLGRYEERVKALAFKLRMLQENTGKLKNEASQLVRRKKELAKNVKRNGSSISVVEAKLRTASVKLESMKKQSGTLPEETTMSQTIPQPASVGHKPSKPSRTASKSKARKSKAAKPAKTA